MLTDSEKKWLKEREMFPKRDFNRHYSCAYCDKFKADRLCMSAFCPIDVAHVVPRDAAEFEARVQKHLMYQYEKTVHCAEITGGFCPSRDTMLYYARLAVEEGMDK